MFKRLVPLPKSPTQTFFLWGPRQSGKTSLLKKLYPNALWFDLLETDQYFRLLNKPWLLREEILALKILPKLIVIDEIQKIPILLDEVHWLIENKKCVFALVGSSARKVKRGHANLLGGRAIRYEMFGLSAKEIGDDFNLITLINNGYLPRHYLSLRNKRNLQSYTNDYLKEEIAAEGLVRNLPVFSNFLHAASFSDGEMLNYTNIASDCNISGVSVKEYFQILEDTLLGRFVQSFTKRPKRKVVQTPKFYFSDVGVVNYLGGRNGLQPKSQLFGKAFENWVCHELFLYREYSEKFFDISYWRLTSEIEVDFILGDMEIAIEVKASENINARHLKNLRQIKIDHPNLKRQLVVSLETRTRKTEDGILILSYKDFIAKLWEGDII